MIYPEPAADLPAVHSYKTPPVRQIQIAFFIFLNECFKLTTFLDRTHSITLKLDDIY